MKCHRLAILCTGEHLTFWKKGKDPFRSISSYLLLVFAFDFAFDFAFAMQYENLHCY